jgi:hypothetical protein
LLPFAKPLKDSRSEAMAVDPEETGRRVGCPGVNLAQGATMHGTQRTEGCGCSDDGCAVLLGRYSTPTSSAHSFASGSSMARDASCMGCLNVTVTDDLEFAGRAFEHQNDVRAVPPTARGVNALVTA